VACRLIEFLENNVYLLPPYPNAYSGDGSHQWGKQQVPLHHIPLLPSTTTGTLTRPEQVSQVCRAVGDPGPSVKELGTFHDTEETYARRIVQPRWGT